MLRPLRPLVLYPVLAIGTFLLVAGGVRALLPWPRGLGLRAKMEYFEAHKDEYDALILGSSRSYRGLDPRIIDAELARAGHPIRTLNLALGGMRTFEQHFLLREVLAMRPARLRYVFFEGGPVGMGLREDHVFREPVNLASERGVLWHTPVVTLAVLRAIVPLPLSLFEKLDQALTHLELLGWRTANYGCGEGWLERFRERLAGDAQRAERDARVEAGAGHEGLEEASGRARAKGFEEVLEDPAPFEARMAAIVEENAMADFLDELAVELYHDLEALARDHGVTLIWFTPPGHEGTPERLRLAEAGVLPRFLHLNDPERFPELFQIDHRFDKGHMNRRGADRLSELFARGVLPFLEGAP